MKWIAVWFFFAALLVTADALAQTGGPPSGELAVDLSEPVPPPPVHVRPAVASEADYIDPERAAGNVGLAGPRNEERTLVDRRTGDV